ncbi:MAG: hypothetical protein NC921_01565 [Candidatus Omnitrophica bacterium]|nr:hypothetical protein [Candidatus Omnitrophota bacterium]MCM8810174.1 hypothetical protein [Candidatus Omnitrophota bacterium]
MEKKKITLIVLIIIFVFLWGWNLKPKKVKKYEETNQQNIIEEKEIIGGIDLRKIENNFSEIRKKIDELKVNKPEKINILKNPLKSWIVKKEVEKIIKKEEQIKEEQIKIEKPDFKISGIVYDKEKPYVILNNEIKEEGNEIGNFIIQKIYPEKIILKDKNENFFTINFDFEKGE